MNEFKKIIIKIDKNNNTFPALIIYETEKGTQPTFELDENTRKKANNLFNTLFSHMKALDSTYKIYCYNYKNRKIVLTNEIERPENYYLVGCDYNSIERIIQKINYVVSLKSNLTPLYVIINNKTFYLNERIIQIKQGIKEPEVIDIETYEMFLKELKPNLFKK